MMAYAPMYLVDFSNCNGRAFKYLLSDNRSMIREDNLQHLIIVCRNYCMWFDMA
ncbi:hypothetical protein CFIICLFH_3158 [Methylobacterium goesingense]|nr:hypothetical protein CFIICLFH_3158 [Methylobacterium goesingense]